MALNLQEQNLKNADQAVADNVKARETATPSPYYNGSPSTPTVLSDANIRESTIPSIQTKATKILDPRLVSTAGSTLIVDPNTPGYSKAAVDRYLAENGGNGNYEDILNGVSSPDTGDDISKDPNYASSLALLDQAKSMNDTSYNSIVDSIKSKYKQLTDNLTKSQATQSESINQALNLGGTSRYAPVSASGIQSAKTKYDIESLAALQDEETGLINQASQARDAKDFQLLDKRLQLVDEKRQEKNKLAEKISTDLAAQNKKIRENSIQSTRDAAVANLVSQGITDPSQILEYLNHDDKGNTVGDFTADEIAKTLKSISPDDDLSKLSGTTRDFFILKGHNQLPSNISSLPEEQQLTAYLASQKKTTSSSTGLSGNKITLSEAKSQGLPLSTVGMSEADIAASFESPEPPHWFTEKLNNEKGMTVLPEIARQTWQTYRTAFVAAKSNAPKPTAKVIGAVRNARAAGETPEEINNFIIGSGYSIDDPAFKE